MEREIGNGDWDGRDVFIDTVKNRGINQSMFD